MEIRWLAWMACSLVAVAACGDDSPANTDGSSESSGSGSTSIDPESSSGTDPSADSSGSSTTTESSESGSDDTSTTLQPESSSSGDSSSSTSDDTTSTTAPNESSSSETQQGTDPPETESETSACMGMGMGLPNDSMCMEDCECESESCYTSALGGLCGECTSDADCPGGGCTPPDPLTSPPVGAVCNDGGFADGCETDAACQDPYICVNVIDVPGLLESNTCSECQSDADCGGDLCSPEYAFPSVGGYWECVEPDSEGLGTACDFAGSGDESCASGSCAAADIMGLFSIGICSECEVDGDCLVGETCEAAEVDLLSGMLVPATCV